MDFSLSESQSLIRDTAERLVRERYDFGAKRKALEAVSKSSNRDMPGFWQEIAELGLLGVGIDEAYDGTGGTFGDLAVVLEAFGRGLVTEPYIATVVLCADIVAAVGNAKQKERILPKIVGGSLKLAFAHAESGSFEEPTAIRTRADKDGAGYRLNGAKTLVVGGDAADLFIVSSRMESGSPSSNAMSLFLIAADAPGLSVRRYPTVDGSGAADIQLRDVSVSADDLIGAPDSALPQIERALDRAIAAHCCSAIGTMNALNQLTLEYLKTRNQFGRPIGSFQVLQHRMVDMTIAEEMAKSMAIYAADQADNGNAAERTKAMSAAKAQIGDAARTVGQGAIQLHGGIGMTDEYSAGHYFKRLTAFELSFGGTNEHLARFARL